MSYIDSDIERNFHFDFRYYLPYDGFDMKKSGLYVLKTLDTDSTPYDHQIRSV